MRTTKQRRGAAVVEFALVSALLFLLLFGIIEVGLLLGDQAQVGAAAREAVRAEAAGSTASSSASIGVAAGAGLHLMSANIALEKSADGGGVWVPLGDTALGVNDAVSGTLVRATVTYSHPLVTTYIFSGSARTLTARLVMQRE